MGRPAWIDDIRRELVDDVIAGDPRTTPTTYLGWRRDRIFRDVIEGGQADFDGGIGHLSGDDQALLYAKYNMERHLDELTEAFGQMFASHPTHQPPTVLDFGCGPFTAGLALAGAMTSARAFRYFGLDRAASMLRLGEGFYEAARTRGQLASATTAEFHGDLRSIDFGPVRGELTIAVASYLFASPSLDPLDLATSCLDALTRIGPGPAAFFYTNSAREVLNEKFPPFRDALVLAGFEVRVDNVETFPGTKSPKPLRYALLIRPATTTIDLR